MNPILLAIDQGTTGTTAIAVEVNERSELKRVADANLDFTQHFPKPGWVEHDPEEIWASVVQTVKQVTSKVPPRKILALGITNQRETLCFWDRKTGQSLGNAIVWQDRRTAAQCDALRTRGFEPLIREKTGLLLDPYFSATKAAWAIEHWPEVGKAAREGRLACGTIDSFLIARLSGNQAHVTEPSNASRTLCFSLEEKRWSEELCQVFGLSPSIWPEIHPSVGEFARVKSVAGLPDGLPITGVLGDQQAALLGQGCVNPGEAKCTYGTGAFLLLNLGKDAPRSQHRLLTTVAWWLGGDRWTYALEGSAFIAGAAVQWLRDGLGLISESAEVERLAAQVGSSEGVVFVPALTGLGAPHWAASATGLLTGLTRGSTRAHIARAVLEGIAFQIGDLLEAMQKDAAKALMSLNVDGGAAANALLMQFQSEILGVKLKRPKDLETTSLGAVFAAGLGAGVWSDIGQVKESWKPDREFEPTWRQGQREQELKRWRRALDQALLPSRSEVRS